MYYLSWDVVWHSTRIYSVDPSADLKAV